MANDNPTAGPVGTPEAASGDGSPSSDLRQRRAQAAEGAKRGPGRPKKNPDTAKPATAPAKVAKGPEFVYSKTGKAFRAVSHVACLQTNTNAFSLSAEEEKDLGEAVGDILLELGFGDTMAAKIVFAVGTVVGVYGTKSIAYLQFKNAQRGSQTVVPGVPPNAKPVEDPRPGDPPPSSAPTPVATAVDPNIADAKVPDGMNGHPAIPESRPGNL